MQTRRLLTTGEAAQLCSVEPDTVLKWIKRGKLPAERTCGGHHRVNRMDLERFLPVSRVEPSAPEFGVQPLRCWEYLAPGGITREKCKQCIVYRVRAAWCFRMAGLEVEIGHARQYCGTSCEDCPYFRRVSGLATKVLVVTGHRGLLPLLAASSHPGIEMRLARNAYEASATLGDFRPQVVVVDEDLGCAGELVECLACDPRIPGVKILLGTPAGDSKSQSRQRAVSVIEKPLTPERIAMYLTGFPVESLAAVEERR